jgi:hypothetical protein
MKKLFVLLLIWSAFSQIHGLLAQNTLGLLSYQTSKSVDGYNLIYPHRQPNVYLLDNCGEIVHSWTDELQYVPGNTAHLLEDGRLVKTKRLQNAPVNDPIWAGGGGAIVEIRNWENELLWSFEQNDSLRRLHHAVEPMPNGNILMISWELKTEEEAIAAGRNPALMSQGKLWPDYLLEVDPNTDSIVWEWHAWDHLVQDFDPSKANYGDPAEHPELIDFNYDTSEGHPDWMHVNAVDYNPELDQVMISVPTFSEVWIIDHSTTTEEAAGHTGGNSGKGGDLLYRWGNPLTYRQGDADDQRLFYPHDLHWVEHPNYQGTIAAYNNRVEVTLSTAVFFTPDFDTLSQQYPFTEAGLWGPADVDRTVLHPDTLPMHSPILSSIQVLPNENLLLCTGRRGYLFELTPDNEVVWEYLVPLQAGSIASQGTELGINDNLTFNVKRYLPDYPAFEGKSLTPTGFIELEPNEDFCNELTSVTNPETTAPEVSIFPNPTQDGLINVELHTLKGKAQVELFNAYGQRVATQQAEQLLLQFDLSEQAAGWYFLSVDGVVREKLLYTP